MGQTKAKEEKKKKQQIEIESEQRYHLRIYYNDGIKN